MASILYVVLLCCGLQEPSAVVLGEQEGFATVLQRARGEYWLGRFAESEALFLSALREFSRIDESGRAGALSELGDVYVNEDKLEDALRVYAESLRIYKRAADKTRVALLLRNLGSVYSLQRRDDDALRVLEEALKTARAAPQPDTTLMSQIFNSLGVTYYRQGNLSKAEKMFTGAAQFLPASSGLSTRPDLMNNLGAVYHRKRQFEKAEEYLLQGLRLTEAQVGSTHPDLTFPLSALAVLYVDAGRYAEAEAQYQRALSILAPREPVFETRIARMLESLSRTYAKAGRNAEADATLSRAAAIARRNAATHPDMASIMDTYASTLKKNGRPREAEELRVEAKRARVAAGLVVHAYTPF